MGAHIYNSTREMKNIDGSEITIFGLSMRQRGYVSVN
jgi:hypothetical protein